MLSEGFRVIIGAFWIVTLVFLAIRIWAGNPELTLMPHNPQYAAYAQVNIRVFALDQPVWVQYGVWFFDALTGNLGISYYFRRPVVDVIIGSLPTTLEVLLTSALLTVGLGWALGWAASSRQHSLSARALRKLGTALYSIPIFWLVLGIIYLGEAGRLFIGGDPYGAPPFVVPRVTGVFLIDSLIAGNLNAFVGGLRSDVLLALPTGLAFCLPLSHRVRSALQERAAASPTIGPSGTSRLPFIVALRTSTAPMLGGLGVLLPFLLGAATVTEWLSNRRGLGWLLLESIYTLDGPLLQGTIVLACLLSIGLALPFLLLGAWLLRKPREAPTTVAVGSLDPLKNFSVFGRKLRSSPSIGFWIGVVIFGIPLVMALAAPVLSPYSPTQPATDTACGPTPYLRPPCPGHPLGTNYFGEDILSRVLWGGRFVLAYTVVALCAGAGLGLAIGLALSLSGRLVDASARILLGGLAAVPCLLLAILFFLSFPISLALFVVFVPVFFRDARDLGLSAGGLGVSTSSRRVSSTRSDALAASVVSIVPGFVARLPRRAGEMILLGETLTFLFGVGRQGVDWGSEIQQALLSNAISFGNPWWFILPGVLIGLVTVGLLLISDGLRSLVETQEPAGRTPQPISLPEAKPGIAS